MTDLPPVVVTLGASAGGISALREFFRALLPEPRICFVVVTRMPATDDSSLSELLGRAGPIPTSQAAAGQRLQGAHVHVMPPGVLMGMRRGVIFFEDKPNRQPSPKPIDFFMRSMAEDTGGRCVGIVLSGTDHDGTMGLKAIKAMGGLTLVQTPATAESPGMPASAIAAGVADLILPAHAMGAALFEYLRHPASRAQSDAAGVVSDEGAPPEDALTGILAMVLTKTGHDFHRYRPAMLRRRLSRRMVLVRCKDQADYLRLLEESPDEARALSHEFLIGVSDFFRDPDAWHALAESVLPALLAARNKDDQPFRVWTPGCSSGEESYSIAMLLLELLGGQTSEGAAQVFGTDIDLEALAVARRGEYPAAIASTISASRMTRFFERRFDKYVVRKPLRDAVMFAPQNLVRDTPFAKLDLVTCRNVLMYFEPALQEQVLQLFHFALKPGGLLWLGAAESLGAHDAMFEPVVGATRLFRRVGGRSHLPRGFAGYRNGAGTSPAERRAGLRSAAPADILHKHLQGREVAAAVLADRDGRALHFHGDTSNFLALKGDATPELMRLVRPELRPALRAAMREALSEAGSGRRTSIVRIGQAAQKARLDVELVHTADRRGLTAVVFELLEGPAAPPAILTAAGITPTDDAIEESRRVLALALEDAERSNEDLRMAGEEKSALHQEVQSSKEQLESSKDELQSLNEQLATVNMELEEKISDVARHADDLNNLLNSSNIAAVLLDRELRIRRFTPAAAELFNLSAGDEGRQLSDMSSAVEDPGFLPDAQAALARGLQAEAEVRQDGAGTGRGHVMLLRRTQPYLADGAKIEGVVATFVDITPLHAAARQMRHLTAILADSNDAVFSHDLQGRIVTWNKGAERLYGYSLEAASGLCVFALVPAAGHAGVQELFARVRRGGSAGPEDGDRLTSDGRTVNVSTVVSALQDGDGDIYGMLSTERDISERLVAESEIRFRRLADDIPALLRVEDGTGMAQFVNRSCSDFTGEPREKLIGRGWLNFVQEQDRQRYLVDQSTAWIDRSRREIDIRLKRHDGEYRWMRSISVPQVDADGRFDGYVVLMLDVEDRKRVESDLVTADRRKDEFLTMLAHELRNPLAPIRNAVNIISRTQQNDHRAQWATGVIGRQTELLAKLLDSLLDVARIARGKTVLELAPVELRVIVERSIELSHTLIDSRRQQLRLSMPHDELFVEGDVTRLTQVFANLLNNASKYTQEGGEIGLAAESLDGEVVMRVSDNGAGLEASMMARVFDLFAQADNTLDRATGGLGLGLTLARQLVELHRGSIQAESAGLGKGSTFTVRLPLLRHNAPPAVGPLPLEGSARAALPSRRILVVDDNIDGAESLARVLGMEGHQVSTSHDGLTAIADAERIRPDIVMLDIGLPGMDGYQVVRHLRAAKYMARTAIFALSGYGRSDDVAKALDAGFDLHFVKPVNMDALLTAVDKAPRLQA